ncbi:hypothetical protein NM688_g1931 [Phlebia brevispora]|uniref:Uncharacterized protein n=1 Tax=Phlebia brevispora TaxID=194682 RepID=A0ACC1TA19_9APHY|nr:hypothetical protein NM688_g1931 [Phlebia brevispora]
MHQVPPHGGSHQGSVSGTYPVDLLPTVEMFVVDRLAMLEKRIEARLASELAVLNDRLDRLWEEVEHGRARQELSRQVLEFINKSNESICTAAECIRDQLFHIGRRSDSIEEVTETNEDGDANMPGKHAFLQIQLEDKLDLIIAAQHELQDHISKLLGSPSARRIHGGVAAFSVDSLTKVPGHYPSAGLRSGSAPLATPLDKDISSPIIRTRASAGISAGTTEDNGVGPSLPSTPKLAERSFAIQATSPQGMKHFEIQTDDALPATQYLRPAQWQDEPESPLSSRESSPVEELRRLMGIIPPSSSSIGVGLEEGQSHDKSTSRSTTAGGDDPPCLSQSVAVGMSPMHTPRNVSPLSSGTQTQGSGSPSFPPSPLPASPTLFGSDSEATRLVSTSPSSVDPAASMKSKLAPPDLVHGSESAHRQPFSSSLSQIVSTPAEGSSQPQQATPTTDAETLSPTPSLSSILNLSSDTSSTVSSNSVSRSSSVPPSVLPLQPDLSRRRASFPSTSDQHSEPFKYWKSIRSKLLNKRDSKADQPATLEDSSELVGTSRSTEHTSPKPSDAGQNAPFLDTTLLNTVHTPDPQRSDPVHIHPDNQIFALSGLDLERSPSILSDLSSQDTLSEASSSGEPEVIEWDTPNHTEHGESISDVSGRKRSRKSHHGQRSKRRKTDSSLTLVTDASSDTLGPPVKKRRGRPRKHPQAQPPQTSTLPNIDQGLTALQNDTWKVVEGYAGPYTWPQRKGDHSEDLSTIQCDKYVDNLLELHFISDRKAQVVYEKMMWSISALPATRQSSSVFLGWNVVLINIIRNIMNMYRKLQNIPEQAGVCGRPDCSVRSFSPEKFVGRLFYKTHNSKTQTMYLVKWFGWPSADSTWEPLYLLKRDLDEEVTDEFVRNFESAASLEGLRLERKNTMVALAGFEDVAKGCLPPYVPRL